MKVSRRQFVIDSAAIALTSTTPLYARRETLRILIVDDVNNHDWICHGTHAGDSPSDRQFSGRCIHHASTRSTARRVAVMEAGVLALSRGHQ
jgi:hypothetical protein